MIGYEQFLQLRQLLDEQKCTAARVAEVMNLNIKTVLKWANRPRYEQRTHSPRPSCLDPYQRSTTPGNCAAHMPPGAVAFTSTGIVIQCPRNRRGPG